MTQESNAGGTESPAEIEQEIARTRARLGSTLDAIEDRLSPEHLMEQGMAYLREEAVEWGAEIGDFVRRNPIPVAILGVGIGWVAYSAMRSREVDWDEEFGAGPEGLYGPAHAGYVDPYSPDKGSDQEFRVTRSSGATGRRGRSGVAERASDIGSRLSSRAQSMRDTVTEGASAYADEASSRLGDLWGRASELADNARELADHARERLMGAAEDTRERASHAMDATRASVQRVQTEVVRTAEERPLLLGAIGLGAGLLIGLCLPTTRAEARAIGRRRDELLEGVRQAGAERLQGVVEAVRHAGEAALDQAKEEGLSREGLTGALDKVQRVAETALDTAKEQAQNVLQGEQAGGSKGQEAGQNTGQNAGQAGAQQGQGQGSKGPAGQGGSQGAPSTNPSTGSASATGGGAGTGASAGGAAASGPGAGSGGSSGGGGVPSAGSGGPGAGGSSSSLPGQGGDSNKGASSTTPKP